jgi:hypothetical protein
MDQSLILRLDTLFAAGDGEYTLGNAYRVPRLKIG